MDDLDRALFEAWNRLSKRVREDRMEMARRRARRERECLTRPLRAWCLCVRASDTRLSHEVNCEITPFKDLPRYLEDHRVRIGARGIRELCKPVDLDWPGVPLDVAAARLGRRTHVVGKWLKNGLFRVRYDPPRVWSRGGCGGGRKVPVVWSPVALDPNTDGCRPPDAIYGALWHSLSERVPEDLELYAKRVRRHHACTFVWRWVCPGLGEAGCGREVDALYAPMPEIGLVELLGDPLDDMERLPRPRRKREPAFACQRCHGVRSVSLVSAGAWSAFVGRVSGGLLYGKEVARPACVRVERRKRARGMPRHAVARRAEVLAMALEGVTRREMAARLGVSVSCVQNHLCKLYRAEGVAGRSELVERRGEGRVAQAV